MTKKTRSLTGRVFFYYSFSISGNPLESGVQRDVVVMEIGSNQSARGSVYPRSVPIGMLLPVNLYLFFYPRLIGKVIRLRAERILPQPPLMLPY
jgi:hypothetical protein